MKAWVKLAALCLFTLPAVAFLTFGADPTVPQQAPAPEVACPSCEDYNPCTVASCDTTTGTCRHDPRDCDDHNPCTTDQCIHLTPPGLPPYGGCAHSPVSVGTLCEDGNPCTQADSCQIRSGTIVCAGAPLTSGES